MTRCVFLGDAHIAPEDWLFQEKIAAFFRSLAGKIDTLVLLGDLFEFWFGFRNYPYQEYKPVLDSLRALASKNVSILFFEGNHDFCMGPVFEKELSARVIPDWAEISLMEKRCFLTHGDLVETKGLRYGIYRRLLKNKVTYCVINLIGPRLVMKLAQRFGRLSHRYYHRGFPPRKYTLYAREKFLEGYDIAIMGHTHVAQRVTMEVGGRKCTYLNCGEARFEENYLTFNPESGFEIKKGLTPWSDETSMPPA